MLYENFLDLVRLSFYVSVAFTSIMFIVNKVEADNSKHAHNKYDAELSRYDMKISEQNFYYQITVVLLLGFIFFSVIKPPSWHLVEASFKKLEEIIGVTISINDSMSSEGKLGKPLSAVDVNF